MQYRHSSICSATWARRAFGIGLALALVFACRSREGEAGSSSGRPELDAGGFDKSALLRAFAECALGTFAEFNRLASTLESECSTGDRARAQTAWRNAMAVWQRAELMQFGPSAVAGQPGGQDKRDPIYAWPLVGRCLVDQTLAGKLYEQPNFAASLVSTRTLAVAEYLLFEPSFANGCPPEADINRSGAWAALGDNEISLRRMAYARVIASDVARVAKELEDAWEPSRGDFFGELANAGKGRVYVSQQQAFNAVTDAMFYLDIQVKNMKVGQPAGLDESCAAPPCVAPVESPWAKQSKSHIAANLDGYERLLRGCGANGSGLGLDDLLTAVGQADLSARLALSVSASRTALLALTEASLEEDIAKNPAGVRALYDALRGNATLMKAELTTVLDLELPKVVASDND